MKPGKFEKVLANLHDKKEYVIHIRNLKQELNHGLGHRVIKFNQKAWLELYIDMNTELRNNEKTDFKKIFFDEQCRFWKNYRKCEET